MNICNPSYRVSEPSVKIKPIKKNNNNKKKVNRRRERAENLFTLGDGAGCLVQLRPRTQRRCINAVVGMFNLNLSVYLRHPRFQTQPAEKDDRWGLQTAEVRLCCVYYLLLCRLCVCHWKTLKRFLIVMHKKIWVCTMQDFWLLHLIVQFPVMYLFIYFHFMHTYANMFT